MEVEKLRSGLAKTAFAFRGYNLENLGRTPELLAHPAFGPVLERHLRRATFVCRQVTGRPVDLIQRVQAVRETTLDEYAEAIALIVAIEMAQLEILEHCFEMRYEAAQVAFGFSLGEVTALIASGVLDFDSALMVPLSLADDCVDLARDVTLAVLFSRGPLLAVDEVQRMCVLINSQGRGVMGISAVLSPNSVLLLGQADTLDRFAAMMPEILPQRVYLRRNQGRWPPMHTPIVWERAIPNRAASLMHAIPGGFTKPQAHILSIVTGKMCYNE
jgi:[acyl-carrier-protein] S-malonyltransferase